MLARVARWEPDARGRLEIAAMEMFRERGYAKTTVADIAARAGLTERTFFRYFADKREVLFSGSERLEATIVAAVKDAPDGLAPLEVVIRGIEGAAVFLEAHRAFDHVVARWAIVVEHPEVRERELIKMASLAAAITKALRARGVGEPAASLAAEAGIAVFKVGFERWVAGKRPRSFPKHIRATADALTTVAVAGQPPPR